jgi:hypothetical protein
VHGGWRKAGAGGDRGEWQEHKAKEKILGSNYLAEGGVEHEGRRDGDGFGEDGGRHWLGCGCWLLVGGDDLEERGDAVGGMWTVESTDRAYFIGLSHQDTDVHYYRSIDYAIYISSIDHGYSPYEKGTRPTRISHGCAAGDRFKIIVTGDVVT